MRHGHTEDTVWLELQKIPDLTITLELVVIGTAEALGGTRVHRNKGVSDRVDLNHGFRS